MVRSVLKWSAAAAALAIVLALASPPGAVSAAEASAAAEGSASRVETVDINAATAEQLQAVPGLGPALAQRIVEFRDKNGPFGSVDELLKVRGIGEKTLERFREYLVAGKSKKK